MTEPKAYSTEEVDDTLESIRGEFIQAGWDDMWMYQYYGTQGTYSEALAQILNQTKTFPYETPPDEKYVYSPPSPVVAYGIPRSFGGVSRSDYPHLTALLWCQDPEWTDSQQEILGVAALDSMEEAEELARRFLEDKENVVYPVRVFQFVLTPVKFLKDED